MYMSPLGYALTIFILTLIALLWPYRRERGFTLRREIAAPRERIWSAYIDDPDDPNSALLNNNVRSVTSLEDDPSIREIVFDSSGGHDTEFKTLHLQVLTEDQPQLSEFRTSMLDGAPFPYGENELIRLELVEADAGSAVTLTWRGQTANLWQYLSLWLINRRYMKRLQQLCETGTLNDNAPSRRSLWTSIVLSVLAVGSFSYVLGWVGGLLLASIVFIHEFGHWLAMRITGQPAPRMTLVPFLGGVAVANHSHKSQFDDAFCTLMGPGFSVFPCAAFLAVAAVSGLPSWHHVIYELQDDIGTREAVGLVCFAIAVAIGLVNSLQLVPMLPLDGGQVLRAVIQSFSGHWARWTMLLVTGLGVAGLIYTMDYLLAAILGLGALQAWHMRAERSEARAMSAPEMAAIGLGYIATLVVHGGVVVFSFDYFVN